MTDGLYATMRKRHRSIPRSPFRLSHPLSSASMLLLQSGQVIGTAPLLRMPRKGRREDRRERQLGIRMEGSVWKVCGGSDMVLTRVER